MSGVDPRLVHARISPTSVMGRMVVLVLHSHAIGGVSNGIEDFVDDR